MTSLWVKPQPLLWALILRDAPLRDLVRVAHTCRALHALLVPGDACRCGDASALAAASADPTPRSLAFWAHMRHAAPRRVESVAQCAASGSMLRTYLAMAGGADPTVRGKAPDVDRCNVVEMLRRQAPMMFCYTTPFWRVADTIGNPYGEFPRGPCYEPIVWACRNGHVAVVDHLLKDPRVDVCVAENAALLFAVRNGHIDVVRALLHDGRADPGARSQMAISLATCVGRLDLVQCLLSDARVPLEAVRNDVFELALEYQRVELIEFYLSRAALDVERVPHLYAITLSTAAILWYVRDHPIGHSIDPLVGNGYFLHVAIEQRHRDLMQAITDRADSPRLAAMAHAILNGPWRSDEENPAVEVLRAATRRTACAPCRRRRLVRRCRS